ncbi:MAG: helix-turn-helix domain-containing protein [Ignisphaera sp.]|uniref:Helix-turn-helix domain-containing protein n=1 Tax=Ignisphaera aggregans TaxID=334771 RepID=A0A7J3I7A1_9CREN
MKSVLELGTRYVVPAVKREVVLGLMRRGFTGIEVAKLLGISPSLVSRYMNGERGAQIDLRRYGDVMGYIERLVDGIAGGQMDQYAIAREIDRMSMYFMAKKYLCSIHLRLEPYIDIARCSNCPELFRETIER